MRVRVVLVFVDMTVLRCYSCYDRQNDEVGSSHSKTLVPLQLIPNMVADVSEPASSILAFRLFDLAAVL